MLHTRLISNSSCQFGEEKGITGTQELRRRLIEDNFGDIEFGQGLEKLLVELRASCDCAKT